MTCALRLSQCCRVHGCLAPAREHGYLCTSCWRGLTPAERATLTWEHELDRDTAARSAALDLEAAWDTPAYEEAA